MLERTPERSDGSTKNQAPEKNAEKKLSEAEIHKISDAYIRQIIEDLRNRDTHCC